MSSEVETSLIVPKDLIRSLPVRSASGLPVHVAASPAAPFSTNLGMTKKARAIARSRFDDYLSRREATSGLGFSRDSCVARVVRGRLQQFNP